MTPSFKNAIRFSTTIPDLKLYAKPSSVEVRRMPPSKNWQKLYSHCGLPA